MIKAHHEQLQGKTPEDVLAYVKQVMGLSRVQEITIKPDVIVVKRELESEEAEVIPAVQSETEVVIEDLLARIDLNPWPLNTDNHPFLVLADVSQKLAKKGLHPSVIVAPRADAELFSAWLGYELYEEPYYLGFRIVYWNSQLYSEKIIVVGTQSDTGYLMDAVEGIVVDLV